MQLAYNPFDYEELADLVNDYNCPDINNIGTEEENNYAIYLYQHDQPTGTKGGSLDDLNANFVNVTD